MNFNISPQSKEPKEQDNSDVKGTETKVSEQLKTNSSDETLVDILPQDTAQKQNISYIKTIVADAFILAVAFLLVFLIISLLSFSMLDPAWSRTTSEIIEIHNIAGILGAYTADILYYLLGLSAWWICFFLIFLIFNLLLLFHLPNNKKKPSFSFFFSAMGLVIVLFAGPVFEQLVMTVKISYALPLGAGGLIGNTFAPMLSNILNSNLTTILVAILFLFGIFLITQTSWIYLLQSLGTTFLKVFAKKSKTSVKNEREKALLKVQSITQNPLDQPKVATSSRKIRSTQNNTKKTRIRNKTKRTIISQDVETVHTQEAPIFSLFKKPFQKFVYNEKEIKQNVIQQSKIIMNTFSQNNVSVKLIRADISSRFITYQIKLNLDMHSQEVRQSCTELKSVLNNDDIFLTQASPISIEHELLIARKKPESISLMEIFSKNIFSASDSNLIIALGKDIYNQPVVVSLEKMPNFLISGKDPAELSLGIRATITSLIARYTSKNLKMIFMGQNHSLFKPYLNLPHLLTPLVDETNLAINVLNWFFAEAKRRIEILKQTQSSDINLLNKKIDDAINKNILIADPFSEDLDDPNPLNPLPILVLIMDELEWLQPMLAQIDRQNLLNITSYSKEIGIHLVLSQSNPTTQSIRPALKYIFPCRLSFQLTSQIESLLILDYPGAESLLGKGDTLLQLPNQTHPIRLQIGTLSQREYAQLTSNFKSGPIFDESIINYQPKIKEFSNEDKDLYDIAVQQVLSAQKTSNSFLQRKMKIGYNLANKLLEKMEEDGLLSKAELGGKREILVSKKAHHNKIKRQH